MNKLFSTYINTILMILVLSLTAALETAQLQDLMVVIEMIFELQKLFRCSNSFSLLFLAAAIPTDHL